MIIHLVDGNTLITAFVIYNFREVSKAILLRFDKPLLGKPNLLMVYDDITCKWKDDRNLVEQNSKLFEQLEYKLKNVMKEAIKVFQP
ncbi:hypothetical protein FRZ67_00580 [Panacibacter ginsenosidivorans]|uniref:Uncharacterized protein n=1 Tax=Panacibacter ginsenosidivorans TaxID=1813871 RepID=A0A5B8V3X0_9BACT|nr:hypothetical protein [Panacibacter ginsenosidivorans]QEC65868.1 hypothetical protein FRZ67_00580 [Panacibacter ginsenosidivorans]